MATYPQPFEYFGEAGFSDGPTGYYHDEPVIPYSTIYNESIDGIENRQNVSWYKGEWAALTQTKVFDVDTVMDIQFKQGWVFSSNPKIIDIEFYIDDMITPYASWRPTAFTITLPNVFFSAGSHTIKLKVTNNDRTLTHVGTLNYRQFRILNYNVVSETPANYKISGHVYNNENLLINNATININGTETTTDENGYYEEIVEPSTYNMIVSKECYSEDTATVTITDSDVVQNFFIDCIICEDCPPCECPPDKLDWWLLLIGAGIGYVLKKSKKDDRNNKK